MIVLLDICVRALGLLDKYMNLHSFILFWKRISINI